jgi:hypothetical protein
MPLSDLVSSLVRLEYLCICLSGAVLGLPGACIPLTAGMAVHVRTNHINSLMQPVLYRAGYHDDMLVTTLLSNRMPSATAPEIHKAQQCYMPKQGTLRH